MWILTILIALVVVSSIFVYKAFRSVVLTVALMPLAPLVLLWKVGTYFNENLAIFDMVFRLHWGYDKPFLREKQRLYERGDRRVRTLIGLSVATVYHGDGYGAERFAREALERYEAEKPIYRSGGKYHFVYEMTLLALMDSWVSQGRYLEAAAFLRERIANFGQPTMCIHFVSTYLYLAQDYENARVMLLYLNDTKIVKPSETTIVFPSKTSFMGAHLKYKLLNVDPAPVFATQWKFYTKWREEADRNLNNPYGPRLHEILDEIQAFRQFGMGKSM